VCGQRGHKAGFVGAVYVDCPNKPCYLCKQPGHTTASCPHNMSINAAAPAAPAAGGRGGSASPAQLLLQREQVCRLGQHSPLMSLAWSYSAVFASWCSTFAGCFVSHGLAVELVCERLWLGRCVCRLLAALPGDSTCTAGTCCALPSAEIGPLQHHCAVLSACASKPAPSCTPSSAFDLMLK
jgi:hypothetical protein